MIGRASPLRSKLHDKNTVFTSDTEEIAFEVRWFDEAISCCVIENLWHDERVLRRLYGVLRSGGRLVLSADSRSNSEISKAEREPHRRRYGVYSLYTDSWVRS